jgi:NADH dehydrogenase
MAAHRVVVVGSGFGGLFATRALRGVPVDVTLIDRTNHHLFQPLLYQVATGILSPGEIAPATRDVLQRQSNAEVIIGDVVDLDVSRRLVVSQTLGEQTVTPYDSLIVSAGSTSSYFGHDEFAVHAPSLKSIDDALEVRGRIFGAFEMAELEPDAERRRRWLTFVVVGGGATGVEMAGQIAELSRRTLRRNFRTFDPADARVVLVEGGHEILAGFGDRLSKSAMAELRRLGVEIHLGALVTNVDATGVDVKSDDPNLERVDAMVKVWAAGVRAASIGSMLASKAGATLDRSGRVEVLPDCTIAGHPEIFVIGDLMALDDLPGVAEVAMQGGIFAALTIRRRVQGRPGPDRFKYRDLGSMASVARFHAVASIGPFRFSGMVGWLLWVFVHLVFLTGFKNRAYTISHWFVSFVGRARSERTITYQQVFGRGALAAAMHAGDLPGATAAGPVAADPAAGAPASGPAASGPD